MTSALVRYSSLKTRVSSHRNYCWSAVHSGDRTCNSTCRKSHWEVSLRGIFVCISRYSSLSVPRATVVLHCGYALAALECATHKIKIIRLLLFSYPLFFSLLSSLFIALIMPLVIVAEPVSKPYLLQTTPTPPISHHFAFPKPQKLWFRFIFEKYNDSRHRFIQLGFTLRWQVRYRIDNGCKLCLKALAQSTVGEYNAQNFEWLMGISSSENHSNCSFMIELF